MDNKEREITNEEKEMILKETQKYTDKLDELEDLHQSIINEDKTETNKDEEEPKNENYNIEENRKVAKEKKKERRIDRKLGYHRRYLRSQVKISNYVLIVLFIVLNCLVIGKYAMPKDTLRSNPSVITTNYEFGRNIDMKVEKEWVNDSLHVKVSMTNNEQSTIKFNPESIKLKKGEAIYVPAILDADKEVVSIEGLRPKETATFTLIFNIDKATATNSTLETVVVSDGQTYTIVTSL